MSVQTIATAVPGVAASRCGWLPCRAKGGLCGRVCPHWRMSSALVLLASAIVGIICGCIWTHYLHIIFAPAALAGVHQTYVSWNYHNLRSFAENNEQLRNSVNTLRAQNEELGNKLKTFEAENKKLQETTKNLSDVAEKLQTENTNLTHANSDLKNTIKSLESVKTLLEQKAGKHVEQLEYLEQALRALEVASKGDYSTFSQHLGTFMHQVDKLRSTRSNFDKEMLNATEALKTIFTQTENWQKEKEIANQQLQKHASLLDSFVKKLESEKSTLNKHNQVLEANINTLKTKEESLIKKLQGLVTSTNTLTQGVEQNQTTLATHLKLLSQLVEAFKNTETKFETTEATAETLLNRVSEIVDEFMKKVDNRDKETLEQQLNLHKLLREDETQLRSSLSQLETMLSKHTGEKKGLEEQINDLKRIKTDLEQIVKELKDQVKISKDS